MTTPFDFTQYLYGPSSLLEDGADSYRYFNGSGEAPFPLSGEVAFYQRINPGFSGNLTALELGLNFEIFFSPNTGIAASFTGSGNGQITVAYSSQYLTEDFTFEIKLESGTFNRVYNGTPDLIDVYYVYYRAVGSPSWLSAPNVLISYTRLSTVQAFISDAFLYEYVGEWQDSIVEGCPGNFTLYGVTIDFTDGFSKRTGDETWQITVKGTKALTYEWLARSSGESQFKSISSPITLRPSTLEDTFTDTGIISYLEIDPVSFPKVPIDLKLEISTEVGYSGSIGCKFSQASTFFARIVGDA